MSSTSQNPPDTALERVQELERSKTVLEKKVQELLNSHSGFSDFIADNGLVMGEIANQIGCATRGVC